LVATQNKTALSLDRIEKRVNARRYAEDYEEEENIEKIRQAQRVWREQASRGKKETYMSEKKKDMQEGMEKMIIHGVKETYNKKREDMQEGMRKIIIINEGKETYILELQGWTFPSLMEIIQWDGSIKLTSSSMRALYFSLHFLILYG
jgi:archaellum component FlaD/FlaE